MTIAESGGLLRAQNDVLIVTHRKPDGDTTGCAAALALALRSLGKRAYMHENPEFLPKFHYLAKKLYPDGSFEPRFVVSVDAGSESILARGFKEAGLAVDLAIDHHSARIPFGRDECVCPDYATCGEIIFETISELGVYQTPEIALPLYIAIATDTGCFKNSNTDARSHRIAAALIDTGIDIESVNRAVFIKKTRARIEIEGRILRTLEFHSGGTIAVCFLSLADIAASGATEDDLDDISSLPGTVEGVDAGVLIRERPEGGCKASMRTTARFDAAAICAALGGGGHVRAAGCDLPVPLAEGGQVMLDAIRALSPDV